MKYFFRGSVFLSTLVRPGRRLEMRVGNFTALNTVNEVTFNVKTNIN